MRKLCLFAAVALLASPVAAKDVHPLGSFISIKEGMPDRVLLASNGETLAVYLKDRPQDYLKLGRLRPGQMVSFSCRSRKPSREFYGCVLTDAGK